jgi:hypothetical protein
MVPSLQTVFPAFMCPNAPADMISAIGSGGQFLNVVPSQNLVWLRMGDEPSNSNVPFLLNDDIWQYVNDLVCSTSSVEEEYFEQEIQLYPNPANEQLTITVKDGFLGKVILYNQVGKKIKELDLSSTSSTLDISNYKNGMYFLSFPKLGRTIRFVKSE